MMMEQTECSKMSHKNSEDKESPKRKNTTKHKLLAVLHTAVNSGLLKEHIILQKHLQNATTSNETKKQQKCYS